MTEIGHYMAATVKWKHVATVLANELRRWGWGDMHYGPQPQEKSFHVDAQVTLIRSVYWSEILQRYVIEYELGRCEQIDGSGTR